MNKGNWLKMKRHEGRIVVREEKMLEEVRGQGEMVVN